MQDLTIAFSIVGAFVIITGLLKVSIEENLVLSRPIIALGIGLLLGPHAFNVLDPSSWTEKHDKVLELIAELTMAIALMAVALRLPSGYFKQNRRSMLIILGLGMPLMWLSSTALTSFIVGLPLWTALLIGAVITPTDPVLSTTIVHGKSAEENIPERIRNLVSAEAGANDGLALPFVFLPMFIIRDGAAAGGVEWLKDAILVKTLGGLVLGAAAGFTVGRLLSLAEKAKTVESSSFLATTLALTLMVLGVSHLVHVNSILAVFTAGIFFSSVVNGSERGSEEKIQEAINEFFTAPIFIAFGLFAPITEWLHLGWPLIAFLLAVLFLRRLPVLFIIGRWLPGLRNKKETGLVGWFGPIGAAAIYYSLHAKAETGLHEVWTVASFVIFGSVIIHGATGRPLSRLLKKEDKGS